MKRNIRILSVLMTLALLITSFVFVLPTSAEGWDGTVATAFAGGTGTESDPYLISNAGELAYLATFTATAGNETSGKYFKVTATEIDLNGKTWTAIGGDTMFQGNFDGNGVVVKNLKIDDISGSWAGLFGCVVGATIKGITVYASGTLTQTFVGALVGRISSDGAGTTLSNCNAYVDFTRTQKGGYSGGAVGLVGSASTIENVNVYGTISFTTAGETAVGGICGRSDPTTNGEVTIKNCKNYATITSERTDNGTVPVGGILGTTQTTANDDYKTTNIIGCVNYGNITATTTGAGRAGGMVGDMSRGTKSKRDFLNLENCVNLGTISGTDAGSLVGAAEGKDLTVKNCFSSTDQVAVNKVYNKCTFNGNSDKTEGLTGCYVGGISLETLTGARVRIDTSENATSGLRFDSKISKTAYEALTAMEGVTVTVGTIIAPTENLVAVASDYDKLSVLNEKATALGKKTYIAVEATKDAWVNSQYESETGYDADANYFSGAVVKILEANYKLAYSAVAYVTVTVGDWSFTFYANDGVANGAMSADRTRTVAQVGELAYNDGTANAGLYTDAQMAILKVYADANK